MIDNAAAALNLTIGLETLLVTLAIMAVYYGIRYWRARGISISLFFAWYDFWIGAYYDRAKQVLYICPLPMVVIKVRLRER